MPNASQWGDKISSGPGVGKLAACMYFLFSSQIIFFCGEVTGGRLQPVLMRPTPQLSVKTRGGGGGGGGSWGGGGYSRGSGGGVGQGSGGSPAKGEGRGVKVRVKVRVRVGPRVRVSPRVRVRVRVRVGARVAVRACSPPVALLQVKIFSCCFNTNMNSLQNFEYFEYKHIV